MKDKGKKKDKTRFHERDVKKKIDVWKYKKYMCKARIIPIETGKNIIILKENEAKARDIYMGYRTMLKYNGKKLRPL